MRKRRRMPRAVGEDCCDLCGFSDDDPSLYGEKVTLKEDNICVHYFCLLTSCGVYQRGAEDEGVFGFLVDDIKQEIRRSARLTCSSCKTKGACVGCNVRNCRKMVHFPCGRKLKFISQFTGLFPSFCLDHSPSQSLCVSPDLSLPRSCSVCLDPIEPVLCFSVLKCPSCQASWFHRDCVQRQAHSAGLFFFRCTLCNNKEDFQEEMLRMGIFIPERDASWEMEENAYSELLEVYSCCDALTCLCDEGRTRSAKTGWFQVIRCRLCGSKGTHRKCSGLKLDTTDWACSDCTLATDGKASLVASPQVGQRSLLSKRHLSSVHSHISSKRPSSPVALTTSPEELLQALALQLRPVSIQVEVSRDQVLAAGLELVRRADFDPTRTLSVRFTDGKRIRGVQDGDAIRKWMKLLVQHIQDSVLFEGPDGSKNLALDSRALREDLYFDVGCLLALSLVHGGPPIHFFSHTLYQCLFNYPPNQPLTVAHMTPDKLLTHQVSRMAKAQTLDELKEVMAESGEYLELAGCNRPISSLEERDALVEDLVNFTLITRMQLPLQRFREGLQTLGVFDQVQLYPSVFCGVFCSASVRLSAQNVGQLFAVNFSQLEDRLNKETPVVSFWRHFLLECEVGRSSISLQDLLRFATGVEELPATSLHPQPSISFLHPISSSAQRAEEEEEDAGGGGGGREGERETVRSGMEVWNDEGLFPQRKPGSKHLLLPVTSTYQGFKGCMEQAISHHVHLHP
ncbi:G2/M phase-specific E3 ubiquitin-protein ligase [Antennarius striatus]|uniref:G2/M phase-specific E3 ubiquitin-protein ligase n=1 Tax=Antennarius striatus TaxID=241820 RepID=UPI0035AF8C33